MKPSSLPRRHFLRGAGGVAVALPFLQSLQSAQAATQGPRRLMVMFQPCGVNMLRFWPRGAPGALSDAALEGTGLEPLRGAVGKVLVIRGLHGSPRGYNRDININDHALGTNTRLTAANIKNDLATGISVDQFIARQINPQGRPALVSTASMGGQSDSNHVSFFSPGTPAPMSRNPWQMYQDVVGLSGTDPAEVKRITKRRQSVLDLVRGHFERLSGSPKLGREDREKLDLHFSGIRDTERALAPLCQLPPASAAHVQTVDPEQVGSPFTYEEYSRMHMDVLILALACGHTNVATLMFGSGAHSGTFVDLGHSHDHHLISHRVVSFTSEVPLSGADAMLHAIDQWHAKQFRYFMDKLDAYTDVSGSVLDNTALLWVNELSDGKSHHYRDLPFVLAGGAGGFFKRGAYVNLGNRMEPRSPVVRSEDQETPHNKLLTMLCSAMGVAGADGGPLPKFGQFGAEGEYPELRA